VKINWAENLRKTVHPLAESLGKLFVETFHYLELGAMVGIYFKKKVYVTHIPSSGYQMLAKPANAGPWRA